MREKSNGGGEKNKEREKVIHTKCWSRVNVFLTQCLKIKICGFKLN